MIAESGFVLRSGLVLKETAAHLQSTCIQACPLPICTLAEHLRIVFPDDY